MVDVPVNAPFIVAWQQRTVVAPPAGIEPATNRLEGGCSIR